MAGNQAIHVNPLNAQEHVSMNGSDWLWAAFSIQAFFLAAFKFVAFVAVTVPFTPSSISMLTEANKTQRSRGTRLFHNIALVVMAPTSSVASFSMATDLGATPIETEIRTEATRKIWEVIGQKCSCSILAHLVLRSMFATSSGSLIGSARVILPPRHGPLALRYPHDNVYGCPRRRYLASRCPGSHQLQVG